MGSSSGPVYLGVEEQVGYHDWRMKRMRMYEG